MMVEKGVVFGRFQVFHFRQMEYVLAAKMRCKKLYIGITHTDLSAYEPVSELERTRMTKRDNPLTYLERFEMIQGAILDFGIRREDFEILPFPISCPSLIFEYMPEDAVYYMNIRTPWDEEKYLMLQNIGAKVEVLMQSRQEKGVTGSQIRALIGEGKDWKKHVPKTVAEYMEIHGIAERIREVEKKFGGGTVSAPSVAEQTNEEPTDAEQGNPKQTCEEQDYAEQGNPKQSYEKQNYSEESNKKQENIEPVNTEPTDKETIDIEKSI